MSYKLLAEDHRHNSNRIGLATLIITTILLVSCPDQMPDPTPDPTSPPAAPTNLTSATGIREITLSWEEVADAESYRVYRNGTLLVMDLAVLIHMDNAIASGANYIYTVRALGNNGIESADSSEVSVSLPNDFDTLADAGNRNPYGIWSDGTTMWVVDGDDNKIYAYNLATKARDEDQDFNTLASTRNRGIWSDGATMWVGDPGADTIFAYNMKSKERDMAKDFTTLFDAGNLSLQGIWGNETMMWGADFSDSEIYSYDINNKAHNEGQNFTTLSAAGNINITDLWSNGTTMWVGDTGGKLYAYNMMSKERDMAEDFNNLAAAGNGSPWGIWANDTTMWVTDRTNDKIYAYNLETREATP